ncbi:MAG: histidine--tRNA ligase [Puniceicoccales bacterium]|jgi:histidyl-tRNA synthetase|nr:histidine--tRNA ligase [Puniceicoccales bacterium]
MGQTLPGFREFYPEDCITRNFIFQIFRQTIHRFGFEEFDGPLLEPLELFTAKSGDEIVSQLFCFIDRGGREVALRPELTPTLTRMVVTRLATLKRPIRWFNIGEHFRYERPQKGRLRSFYQMNVDILCETSIRCDGELIFILIQLLQAFGLTADDFSLRISDRHLWVLFLEQFAMDGSQISQILTAIDRFEEGNEEIFERKISKIAPDCGNRLCDEILQLRQCKDLHSLKRFFPNPREGERIAQWETLFRLFDAMQLNDYVAIDFGIVRGLAYYTGFVFEAYERHGQSRALAGGGRYDNLAEKLYGTPMAACGFAIGDVTLENLLRARHLIPGPKPSIQIFAIFDSATEMEALAICAKLRQRNIATIYDFSDGTSFAKQLKRAGKSGACFALFIGTTEVKTGQFFLKNLLTGEGESLSLDEILNRFSASGCLAK